MGKCRRIRRGDAGMMRNNRIKWEKIELNTRLKETAGNGKGYRWRE